MMKQVKQTHLTLRQGQFHRAAASRALELVCGSGTAWITRPSDPNDYILCSGEQLTLSGGGPVVIQAMGPLELDLHYCA
jgi:hypothetical protein